MWCWVDQAKLQARNAGRLEPVRRASPKDRARNGQRHGLEGACDALACTALARAQECAEEALVALGTALCARKAAVGSGCFCLILVARVVACVGELAEGGRNVLADEVECLGRFLVQNIDLRRHDFLNASLVQEACERLRVIEQVGRVHHAARDVSSVHAGKTVDLAGVATDTQETRVNARSVQEGKHNVIQPKCGRQGAARPRLEQALVPWRVLKRAIAFLCHTKEGKQILLVEVDAVETLVVDRVVGCKLGDKALSSRRDD